MEGSKRTGSLSGPAKRRDQAGEAQMVMAVTRGRGEWAGEGRRLGPAVGNLHREIAERSGG